MVLFLINTDGPFLDTHGQWKVEYSVWAESAKYNIYIFVCYISIIFSWYCGQLYVRTGRISNQAGHQQRVFCQPDSQLYEQATQTQLLLLSFLISLVKHCHSLLFTYLYLCSMCALTKVWDILGQSNCSCLRRIANGFQWYLNSCPNKSFPVATSVTAKC